LILATPKKTYDLTKKTLVMGILNITRDSFSDGGKYFDIDNALKRAHEIEDEGAHIIDLGAESTRPGFISIDEKEEFQRLLPLIERLRTELTIPISIDTYKANVAKKCIEAGAHIINDITGFKGDINMAAVAAALNVPSILMHMRGSPDNIHIPTTYENVLNNVKDELQESISIAMHAGVKKENIILDPGIGFNKTSNENLYLIHHLSQLKNLGFPILMAASRKRFIGEILETEVKDRLEGSLAVAVISAREGAHIIRVHDVKETVYALKIVDALKAL